MSKVSVVVPIYNVEKYLNRCLDSLVNQSLQDIQIILVNDGSTDESGKIAKKYQNNWSQQKIADFYKVSRTVIKRILEIQNNGIVIRDRTSKYKYQQDIFENIDTAEKAYWLGFLAADGCNY